MDLVIVALSIICMAGIVYICNSEKAINFIEKNIL